VTDPGYLRVYGHEEIRRRLAKAAEASRLPQSLLLHGPRGIGKQRLALWTAAALNCAADTSRPCGECRSCRLASRLEHPDIHWFFPLPRPKRASGAAQLRQKLEESRAAALEERRNAHSYTDEDEGATGIYVGAVQQMRLLAQKSPAMGSFKVLVIGRAEALTPGMGSPEAANALLKLLEEPPADTTLILTCDVPGALLPTIRSRVQAIKIAPLGLDQVAEYLQSELELSAREARRLAGKSGGSIGRALQLQLDDDEEARKGALLLAKAALEDRLATGLAAAHGFRSTGARGAFARLLLEAQSLLRDLIAHSAGAEGAVSDPDTVSRLAGERPPELPRILQALDAVAEAQELAERNVNPQLIVANLSRLPGSADRGSSPGAPALESRPR
jgi:DNA polymerase-3 subunit delta'